MAGVLPGPAACVPAGFGRRFAALVYDGLLLLAVLFLGTLVLLPLSGGEAITPQDSGPWEYLYRGWVALITLGFFGIPWTRRGQTLGMMSWKIRLERRGGGLPGWPDSTRRLLVGGAILVAAATGAWLLRQTDSWVGGALLLPAAVNYLWMAFDRDSRTLQDMLTGGRVVCIG